MIEKTVSEMTGVPTEVVERVVFDMWRQVHHHMTKGDANSIEVTDLLTFQTRNRHFPKEIISHIARYISCKPNAYDYNRGLADSVIGKYRAKERSYNEELEQQIEEYEKVKEDRRRDLVAHQGPTGEK